MKTSTIIQLTARYQLAQTLFVLVATMVSPILIHLLPDINGYTPGAVLLPIFFAPLIASENLRALIEPLESLMILLTKNHPD